MSNIFNNKILSEMINYDNLTVINIASKKITELNESIVICARVELKRRNIIPFDCDLYSSLWENWEKSCYDLE